MSQCHHEKIHEKILIGIEENILGDSLWLLFANLFFSTSELSAICYFFFEKIVHCTKMIGSRWS